MVAERYMRTACRKLYLMMYFHNSFAWTNYVKLVMNSINSTCKRDEKYTPFEIVTSKAIENSVMRSNALKLKKKYEEIEKKVKKRPYTYKIGDTVRAVRDDIKTFEKSSYVPKFTEQLYTIEKIYDTIPNVYKLNNGKNRRYYYEELSRVKAKSQDGTMPSYVVLKTRNVDGRILRSGAKSGTRKEYFIQGLQDKNLKKWVPENDYLSLLKNNLVLTS